MTAFPDHYAALGIDPTADQEVIAAAYRALAKKYHPDTGATKGTASAERFAEIQQAYEVLGSPESRKRYDQELLDATQRELDEHLARKQRKIAGTTEPPPPPDLGAIRPERRGRKSKAARTALSIKEMGPFLVVSGLLMAVAGGIASLYLQHTPLPPAEETPPPPVTSQLQSAPAPAAAPAPTPVAAPAPQPAQQQAATPAEPPLFGTSLMDEAAAPAATGERAEPPPEPEQDVAEPPPPPVPKAKPRQTVAEPAPEPDAAPVAVPETTQARAARFTVVIYEKYRTGDIIQEEGRVVFASQSRCAAFGERAVLRRLAPYEGQRQRPRIWYECVEAP